MAEQEAIDSAGQRKATHAAELVAAADLRVQVVLREVNHVLGLGRDHVQLADYGAALVVAALDAVDESAILTRFVDNGKRLVREDLGEDHTPTAGDVAQYIPEDLRSAFWERYLNRYFDERGA